MTKILPVIFILIIAGVMVAGCTLGKSPVATPTLAPVSQTPVGTPVQQPSISLGDHYLQKSYSFQSEKDVFVEQFRVDNPSWGIQFTVLPLNDNVQYCWFDMKVTNMDTGQSYSYGYGRDKGFDVTPSPIPMYTTGPYKIEMTGNRVKVDVDAAKRIP